MTKAELKSWNLQILYAWEGNLFQLKAFTDDHFRLTRSDGLHMDYWPSTNRATWIDFKPTKSFKIHCLDNYLHEKFKP